VTRSSEALRQQRGHLIRRTQRIHDWLWNSEVSSEITAPQFGVLSTLLAEPNVDQKTLGKRAWLDRSTAAEVVARLVSRQLVQRLSDPEDHRRNVIRLTRKGARTIKRLFPIAGQMNRRLLSVLTDREQGELIRLLNLLVEADDRPRSPGPLVDNRRSGKREN
jgi:MarR family transcriptional regulator, temperature-dependent positive regulator of motility